MMNIEFLVRFVYQDVALIVTVKVCVLVQLVREAELSLAFFVMGKERFLGVLSVIIREMPNAPTVMRVKPLLVKCFVIPVVGMVCLVQIASVIMER